MGKCFERKEMHCHSCGLCQHLCQCISFWVFSIPVDWAHIPQSLAIERQRTGAHTVRAGKLRPLGVLLPNRRKSPELTARHRPSEKSAGSFFFRSLPLARTSDFCAGRRNSFAEASSALPQIAPVPLSFSGLPDFQAPHTSSAISLTSASFAHCSSSVSLFPISQEAKPHCGERYRRSRSM